MWLKPPEIEHECNTPSFHSRDLRYLGAIWRCDICLNILIVKKLEVNNQWALVWRPYKIGD